MWKGMVGFDRPTWIRSINRTATWLLLGQFFWHYLIDNERFVGEQKGFTGGLAPLNPVRANGKAVDRVRDWEALVTLAATSFYMSGRLVPLLTYGLDPVNKFNMLVAWSLDYYVSNDFIVNVGQKFFVNTTDAPVYESWGLGGLDRGRSETQLRFTYQF
jgi:hypothetical protein